jgi:hypothetical protein
MRRAVQNIAYCHSFGAGLHHITLGSILATQRENLFRFARLADEILAQNLCAKQPAAQKKSA